MDGKSFKHELKVFKELHDRSGLLGKAGSYRDRFPEIFNRKTLISRRSCINEIETSCTSFLLPLLLLR
ncbi:MAG: hypothetical protein WB581_01980 [Halobacteriota archaeon]